MMATLTRERQAIPALRGMTVAQARRAIAEAFRGAGLDAPELDARLLAGHALALDHSALIAEARRVLGGNEADALEALAAERLSGKPLARIVGVKEFWGLGLRINEATLVPRPETETVVEAALAAIDADGARTRPLRIADLGTGSGALLIALLSELPQAIGIGTDVNAEAVAIARTNAGDHELQPRARWAVGDFGAALAGGFDLVVSNPPYVASGDIAGLAPEVRSDPRRALDGGPDGLACYRAIAADARRLLTPRGHLVVELGAGQEQPVAAVFRSAGLMPAPARTDLSGLARALHARVATVPP